jgi:hypothetical protein
MSSTWPSTAAGDGLTEPGDRAAERLALAHALDERVQDVGHGDGDRQDHRDLEDEAQRRGQTRRQPLGLVRHHDGDPEAEDGGPTEWRRRAPPPATRAATWRYMLS